jgi:hypothetical protein
MEQQAADAASARQQLADQRAQWRSKVAVMQDQFQAAQALLQVSLTLISTDILPCNRPADAPVPG